MVAGTKQDLLDESQIFTAGWQFMKMYANPETDEDWVTIVQAAKKFPIPFKNSKFATEMIIAIVNQIELSYKQKYKEELEKRYVS